MEALLQLGEVLDLAQVPDGRDDVEQLVLLRLRVVVALQHYQRIVLGVRVASELG
ncbi:MAG: hypothetical protein AAF353_15505 [Pseudomonadota bacterium]